MKEFLIHLICNTTKTFPIVMFFFLTMYGSFVVFNAYRWRGVLNMAIVYLLIFFILMICGGAAEFCFWFFKK